MSQKDKYDLDLPDAPDFISEEPRMTWEEMFALCEKNLPYWNEERLKNPPPLPPEPFELLDD